MSLSKQTVVDRVEVLELGQIQVRQVIRIIEDDVIISQKFHRYTLQKGDDLTGQDVKVTSIANAVWNV